MSPVVVVAEKFVKFVVTVVQVVVSVVRVGVIVSVAVVVSTVVTVGGGAHNVAWTVTDARIWRSVVVGVAMVISCRWDHHQQDLLNSWT